MKKIYLILSLLVVTLSAQAQILNAGLETWRTYSSGSSTPKNLKVPTSWYAVDSLIIADGEAFGSILMIPDSVWRQQVFKDSGANAHGGTYAAKLVTKDQDTLGIFPGILSNAEAHISVSLSGVGPITYTGGTAVTLRPTMVSAWVKYSPAAPTDSGSLYVEAYGTVGTVTDSLIGVGYVKIGATASYTQISASVYYATGSAYSADLLRIYVASSADTAHAADNSTLWVDDINMVGIPQSVGNINSTDNSVIVYPNPATGILHFNGVANTAMTCNLTAVSGQVIATQSFAGTGAMDVTALATGLYFYTITDNTGNVMQRGKVNIAK